MTRKHFILIAQTVALLESPEAREEMADTWATILAGENQRFNPAVFRLACNAPNLDSAGNKLSTTT